MEKNKINKNVMKYCGLSLLIIAASFLKIETMKKEAAIEKQEIKIFVAETLNKIEQHRIDIREKVRNKKS